MCAFSAPKSPTPPPLPPPPPEQPRDVDPKVQAARAEERRRAAAAYGRQGTILTGPLGPTAPARTAGKTLFGQ